MEYDKNYQTRSTAKIPKTKLYSSDEIKDIQGRIEKYFKIRHPNTTLNTIEANYEPLVEAVNYAFKQDNVVLTARFVCDFFNLENSSPVRKNRKKVDAIADFIYNELTPKTKNQTIIKKPEEVLPLLIQEFDSHNLNEIYNANKTGIYQGDAFYKRKISYTIEDFLQSEKTVLMIAGESGIGKTTSILNFLENCSDLKTPIYFNCSNYLNLGLYDILKLRTKLIETEIELTFSGLLICLEELISKPIIIILDGLERLNKIDVNYFKEFSKDINEYATQSERRLIKFILTINNDYLFEKLPGFSRETGLNKSYLSYDLFYCNQENKPFFEIGRLEIDNDQEQSELKSVYELFRTKGVIKYHEKNIGVKPLTPFEYLGDLIKKLIAHPFTLKAFLITYHEKEIPENVSSTHVYVQLINHLFEQIPNFSNSLIGKLNTLLSSVAIDVYFKGSKTVTFDGLNKSYTKDEIDLLNSVLSHTPFLVETNSKFNPFGHKQIRFASDWYYEYFLFLSLFKRITNNDSSSSKSEIIKRFFDTKQDSYFSILRSLTILGEAIFFEEIDLDKEIVYDLINGKVSNDQSQHFTNLFFDAIRINYSFENIERIGLLSRHKLQVEGVNKILSYVERLEEKGQYSDALSILKVDDFWNHFIKDLPIANKKYISSAYNLFYTHSIDEALVELNKIKIQKTEKHRAKINFIKGRVYQFQQKYKLAAASFDLSKNEKSKYGFMCAHQLAFIKMMQSSNYKEVGALLGKLEKNISNVVSYEQQLVTRELYATCLYRSGQFEDAENILNDIIAIRKKSVNYHKSGTALRALSELYFYKFEFDKAVVKIEESIEALIKTTHYLSLSYSLEIKAQIFAVGYGDFQTALDCIDESIALCERANKNEAMISWSQQTKAMVLGFKGDIEEMLRVMKKSEHTFSTPLQKLRNSFIVLISKWIHRNNTVKNSKREVIELIADFKNKGIGWYPIILNLLMINQMKIEKTLDYKINLEGLKKSFLFNQIFQD